MGRGARSVKAKVEARPTLSGKARKVEVSTGPQVKQRLAAALEQHAAVSEILQVISASPSDVQPVLDAVAERAARLCKAPLARVLLVDGNVLRAMAEYSLDGASQGRTVPLPFKRTTIAGRAILDRTTVHYDDIVPLLDSEYPDALNARRLGLRAVLAVPLMREGNAYGAVLLWRRKPGLFSPEQVALVRTFAQQAAIALNNVRLFKDTKEALEQQTATSEILRVISTSPTDAQPVFDAIVKNAVRLCDARFGAVFRLDRGLVHLAAHHNFSRALLARFQTGYPMAPNRGHVSGRTILTRAAVQVPDILADEEYLGTTVKAAGFRSLLGVPLLHGGRPIGAIVIYRAESGQFADKHVELLETFADQAVIAIENVRLFNETREALERQTATSEVLGTISGAQTNASPVFETIARNAHRLSGTVMCNVLRYDGTLLHIAASYGFSPEDEKQLRKKYPVKPGDASVLSGRVILSGRVEQIDDVLRDPLYDQEHAATLGLRRILGVPMLRDGAVLGVIVLGWRESGQTPAALIDLLKTFADQAVIAIENVRLFNETREALEQQRASGEVLGTISSSIADTKPVFDKILESCERLFSGTFITINVLNDDGLVQTAAHHGPKREEYLKSDQPVPVDEMTATGICMTRGSMLHFPDIEDAAVPPGTRSAGRRSGFRSALVAPMLWEGKAIGSIVLGRDNVGPFSDKEMALLKTFADQAVIAIQNARLLREIQDKSRQLEVASQHKSEFLANMSHELRTPLNAIIGFSEVLAERMFGEVNDKQAEYLSDILESGRHLLSLINDILDLSKIEAGRMELELSGFHLPSTIENTLTLVRERALRRGIELGLTVDEHLGMIRADERKVKQVLLNLLSNALKFTPEGGRIDVLAAVRDGTAEISVTDTGVGIAPEDQATVFEEFRQVGAVAKKVEGTGLGLAISRKFIELHGGKIWVTSQVGKGSTFTFTLPLR